MITIQLTINGTNLSSFIKYPVNYTNKNLDESLNLLELTLFATNIEEPFKPNTIADIIINDGNFTYLSGQFVISGDTVERAGVTNKYHHKISLIELTYLLSLEVLPDMTITRVSVVDPNQIGEIYEPTLKDVVLKILKYSEGTFSKTLTLGTATANILDNIQAPELTLTRYTTLEALRLVFGIAKIVPYCLVEGFLNHIGVTSITATNLTNYAAKNEAYNSDQFRTKLYSPVENFIGGGDLEGSVIEPSADLNVNMTTRSPGDARIQNDAAIIKLNRPIYKVEGLYLKPTMLYVVRTPSGSGYLFRGVYIGITNTNKFWLTGNGFEITKYLVEKQIYDLEPNIESGKGIKIYYEQGKKTIEGLTHLAETWNSFFQPARQAWRNIIKSVNYEPQEISFTTAGLTSFLSAARQLYQNQYGVNPTTISNGVELYGFAAEGYFRPLSNQGKFQFSRANQTNGSIYPIPINTGIDDVISPTELTDEIHSHSLRIKVKYTPYINTKIFTYKERKEIGDPIHETTMFYNQSANTISDETLAELHDKVIKRGNAPTQTIKKLHSLLNTIPGLGRLVGNYVLTAQDIQFLPDHANVEYVLSKDYAKLNQYVAVLEKYRQFAIPSERVVDRQFTINEFAKFSRTTATKTSALNVGSYMGTNEIDVITLRTDATFKLPDDNTVYPAPQLLYAPTNFAFNNSLVFETSFRTNNNAGSESIPISGVTTQRMEKPILYTNNIGYFEKITIVLATGVSSVMTANDIYELPIFTFNSSFVGTIHALFTNLEIEKDARENLSISYILHHIDETQKLYINRGWALRNGLIGGPGYTGLKFAYFNLRPVNGRDNIVSYDAVGLTPFINITSNSSRVTITHTPATVFNAKYWGVVDENNNLLFWLDEPCVTGVAPAPLYINFSNTY
jgi:hypothetical protein